MAGPFFHSGLTPRRSSRRAFSTLELVTALAIGMVLTVVGLAGFRVLQSERRVEAAASRLSNVLSSARTLAVSQNSYYQVALDLDSNNYWIDEIDDPDVNPGVSLTPKVVHPEELGELVEIEGVLVQGGGPLITTGIEVFIFSPDGSADNDVIITLFLRGQDPTVDENLVSVRIYGPTGQNMVFERERATF
jgi:Tfp pilus assembly protein FimT